MRIVLLTGGEGAGLARDLATLLTVDDTLDVVVPVTHDLWGHGLKVCPDVDAFLALQGSATPTFAVADELAAVGFSPAWMRPSDADVARQLVRTELLQAGYTLSDATAAMATRASLPFGLRPVSDDRAELHVVVEEPDGRRAVHVAEYLADPQIHRPVDATVVATSWSVSAPVGEVVTAADVVILGPSSPVLALDPLLTTPGLRGLITAPVLRVDRAEPEPAGLDALAAAAAPDPLPAVHVPNEAADVLAAARDAAGVGR
jgi:LPPG:FO 2-phospho-L-lactate transferase